MGRTYGNDESASDFLALSDRTTFHPTTIIPITIFNPLRADWDSSWREDPSLPPFKEQVEWELEMQERADVVVFYFGPHTDAPITLLELGLCAPRKSAIVACHPDYKKRGNVLILCKKYGHVVVDDDGKLCDAVYRNFDER
ncbi:hypothetical protein QBC46DRAFT_424476 [Diplogelasinospora grovesii]|uniref:Uncharacterized protein n=1 Tax=Diplogelasinospora grovesii TaxID=303347 RepID=A0AAN6S983_9PEZI|nr:hypothetical protein QBC46DRAFT_424476 [Diplogelasinospora grovesii]